MCIIAVQGITLHMQDHHFCPHPLAYVPRASDSWLAPPHSAHSRVDRSHFIRRIILSSQRRMLQHGPIRLGASNSWAITLTPMSDPTSRPDPCSVQLRAITGATAYLEHDTVYHEKAFYTACPKSIKEKANAFLTEKSDLSGILQPH